MIVTFWPIMNGTSGKRLPLESYLLDRRTGAVAVQTIGTGSDVMKTQKKPPAARSARGLSDAVIEKRYLDLQKLRDAVRAAELGSAAPKQEHRKAAELVSAPRQPPGPNFGGER
jgi:hypothetical protein